MELKQRPKLDVTRVKLTPGQQRALEGLERGRKHAIEQAKVEAAKNAALVMNLALIDLNKGRPARGRAGRISRKLGKMLAERSVRRILAKLSVCPIASVQNGHQQNKEVAHGE